MGRRRVRGAVVALTVGLAGCNADDPLQGVSFVSIATSRADPRVIYAAANSSTNTVGIFRSDDGGETWSRTSPWWTGTNPQTGESYRVDEESVAASPVDPRVVLVGTRMGDVLRSADGGGSWSHVAQTVDWVQRLAFAPGRGDRAYALALGDLWTSTDAGRSWTLQREAASSDCRLPDGADIAFDAVNPDRMYAATWEGVAVSDDGGSCWKIPSPPGRGLEARRPEHVTTIVASPTEGGRVWVANAAGVWASADGAQTFTFLTSWMPISTWPDVPAEYGAPRTSLNATTSAYVDGAGAPALVFGTSDVGVVRVNLRDGTLDDVGASLIRRAAAIDQIVATPSGVLLAGAATCSGRGGVFATTDRGDTWTDELVGHAYPPLTEAIGDAVPHEVLVIFYRDVSLARKKEIMREHNVTPHGYPLDSLFYALVTPTDDPRSPSDLIREFEALDEVDCAMNDFYF